MFLVLLFLISTAYGPVLAASENPENVHAVGWQSSPGRRGTWNIVSSCATTIFACTWSIQHLNVPGPPPYSVAALMVSNNGRVRRLLRSCKWMAITILFPEFIMVHAFFELIMAVQATEMIKDRTDNQVAKYPWLIRMFVLSRGARKGQQEMDDQNIEAQHVGQDGPIWTLTHSYFANMGGLFYEENENSFPLTASQYAEESTCYSLPEIREEDIMDKGKHDLFAKGLAVLQIAQLVLSLIVRATRNLRFTQLETLTFGLAVCGLCTYALYLYKPQKVDVPITVKKHKDFPHAVSFKKTYDSFWKMVSNLEGYTSPNVYRIRNDNFPLGTSQTARTAIPILAVLSAAFGCLHIIAWNFEFPTVVEKLLWRIATVVSITIPVVGLITIPLAQIPIQAGDPREFMRKLLEILREMSWDRSDNAQLLQATRELEEIYNNPDTESGKAQKLYSDIFASCAYIWDDIINLLRAGIIKNGQFDHSASDRTLPSDGARHFFNHPDEFWDHFMQLCIRQLGLGPKRLIDNARTNIFPQKSLLPNAVNLLVLYTTSLVYCLSRLTIMGLALSSLRSMPDEVYLTTWTTNIPAVQ
ncbi:hypothetical protein N7474_002128 [Penicillium riverlandense]|uniref:uncharacterized protein n=1 Tax=Penicillium riverlandense TaxID=1903569 RepID=UPI0025466B48|nr:uncharacterized protein N7474_002128 [Penicillium riverlandense]KAJ5833817.1 hypothetical protein N7474_002128 [Penicillium riverlandense]